LLQLIQDEERRSLVGDGSFVKYGKVQDGVVVLCGHLQAFDDFTLHEYRYMV
jgi:hypothetical protein